MGLEIGLGMRLGALEDDEEVWLDDDDRPKAGNSGTASVGINLLPLLAPEKVCLLSLEHLSLIRTLCFSS